jgi:hypothetical protein
MITMKVQVGLGSIALPLAMLLLASPVAAAAQDRGVAFVGGSASDGFSAYAGAMSSLPGSSLGRGLGIRATVNGGQYHYDRAGTDIRGRYVGAEAALVYQTSGGWGWANLSAGPRVTDTGFSPADPGNAREGTKLDLGLGTEGVLGTNAFRLGWYASYGVWDEGYQVQIRPGVRVNAARDAVVGVEGGFQGDPSYNARNLGLFYGQDIGGRWRAQLAGGITDQEGRSAKAYGSIGFSRIF